MCRRRSFTVYGRNLNGVISDLPSIEEYVKSQITCTSNDRSNFEIAATHIDWYYPDKQDTVERFKLGTFSTEIRGGSNNNNMAKGMVFETTKEDGFFRVVKKQGTGYNNYLIPSDILYETDYSKTEDMLPKSVHKPGSATMQTIPATDYYGGRKYYQNLVDKHIQEMHYRGSYAICVKGKYRFETKLDDYIYPSGDYVRDENGNYKTYVDNNGTVREIPINPAYSFIFNT